MEAQLLEGYAKLPRDLQAQIVDYIQFLLERHKVDSHVSSRSGYGIAKGKVVMAEDFDEPIDDFNDYQ